jgi:hypothetical protein
MITDPPAEGDPAPCVPPAPRLALLDPFAPVALVTISVLIFLFYNASSIGSQKSQLRTLILQRQSEVNQASRTQAALQNLAAEILQLSKSEPQLSGLVDKYQIRQAAPPQ